MRLFSPVPFVVVFIISNDIIFVNVLYFVLFFSTLVTIIITASLVVCQHVLSFIRMLLFSLNVFVVSSTINYLITHIMSWTRMWSLFLISLAPSDVVAATWSSYFLNNTGSLILPTQKNEKSKLSLTLHEMMCVGVNNHLLHNFNIMIAGTVALWKIRIKIN